MVQAPNSISASGSQPSQGPEERRLTKECSRSPHSIQVPDARQFRDRNQIRGRKLQKPPVICEKKCKSWRTALQFIPHACEYVREGSERGNPEWMHTHTPVASTPWLGLHRRAACRARLLLARRRATGRMESHELPKCISVKDQNSISASLSSRLSAKVDFCQPRNHRARPSEISPRSWPPLHDAQRSCLIASQAPLWGHWHLLRWRQQPLTQKSQKATKIYFFVLGVKVFILTYIRCSMLWLSQSQGENI